MNNVTPIPPSQPKTKRRSIKTKFLLALLALSLLPLILFVAMGYPGIVYVQERMGRGDLLRLANDQATIVQCQARQDCSGNADGCVCYPGAPAQPLCLW